MEVMGQTSTFHFWVGFPGAHPLNSSRHHTLAAPVKGEISLPCYKNLEGSKSPLI